AGDREAPGQKDHPAERKLCRPREPALHAVGRSRLIERSKTSPETAPQADQDRPLLHPTAEVASPADRPGLCAGSLRYTGVSSRSGILDGSPWPRRALD